MVKQMQRVQQMRGMRFLAVLLAMAFWGGGRVSAFAPPGITPAPPIIYRFIDTPGSDYRTLHPEYGPIGTLQFVTWEDINPGPGVFNWGPIENLLNKEANLRVTLPDGQVIAKPLVLRVDVFLADYHLSNPNYHFWDCTPQWVYQQMGDRPSIGGRLVGHILTCGDQQAVLPAYDTWAWRNAHAAMVRALGARYANDPRLAAVMICTGIDGETTPIKDAGGCKWGELTNTQAGNVPYRFRQWVLEAMGNYRQAFPNKNVYIMIAPSVMRKEAAEYAATLNPPVGIQNAGLDIDIDSWQGYGGYTGMWDMFETYSDTLPIWIESRYGLGNAESRYWTWIAGLHYHPDGIDVHPEFLTQSDPAWLAFVQEHLGKTIQTTPDVWTVLRDSEYPKYIWNSTTGAGISGKMGDWTYWLYRVSDNPRLWRADLPAAAQSSVYARQCRLVDAEHPLVVQVDRRVWFYGQPAVVYVLAYGLSGQEWRETAYTAVAETITITAPKTAYVHRVRVVPLMNGGDEPTATPTAVPQTPTASSTPTATPTATITPTPAPTTMPPRDELLGGIVLLVMAIIGLIWALLWSIRRQR